MGGREGEMGRERRERGRERERENHVVYCKLFNKSFTKSIVICSVARF